MRVTQAAFTTLLALFAVACAQDAADSPPDAVESAPELFCGTSSSPEDLAERASPLDSVMFDLGGAPAKLCYGRPSANGRVMVGELDPFDVPWRMGANEPTTLHLASAATVGGVEVDAGSYALYAIPTTDTWTVVVNGNPDRWGVPITDEVRAADVGSFEVTPEELEEYVETLTFSVEAAEGGSALVFSFENRTFAIPVRQR